VPSLKHSNNCVPEVVCVITTVSVSIACSMKVQSQSMEYERDAQNKPHELQLLVACATFAQEKRVEQSDTLM